ncbi:MAG: hypothetical protein CSB49_04320 [Proteobacteria bacterium]|nr:MAG: hypothetical protein CSB49_04320 [Pseudomonadota bacterium]
MVVALMVVALMMVVGCSFDGAGLFIDARAAETGPDGGDFAVDDEGPGDLADGPRIDVDPDLRTDLPQPTCTDTIKNGAETDVDCGGPCSPCGLNKTCEVLSDCESPLLCDTTAQTCRHPETCAELHAERPTLLTGNYMVQPLTTQPAVTTKCDMSTDGGGWTLIMRTVWDWNDTKQLMTGWAGFYTSATGGVNAGYRVPGMLWPELSVQTQLLVRIRVRLVDGSSCLPLLYSATGVSVSADPLQKTLEMKGFSGFLKSAGLSTTDSGPDQGCLQYSAVPWFYNECCLVCPSFAGSYWSVGRPTVSDGFVTKVDLKSVCGDKTVEIANGFYGVEDMEWYLR